MDGPFFEDTYTVCQDAHAILRYLVDHEQQLAIARQARIACLLSQPALTLRGEPAAAVIAAMAVQGMHRLAWPFFASRACTSDLGSFDPLEFIIYIDAAEWDTRGREPVEVGASTFPILREALIFHELLHLRQLTTADGDPKYHQDGREMLALRSHTYECFQEEILKYGPTTLGLDQIALDVVAGHHAESERHRLADEAKEPERRRQAFKRVK